MTANKPTGACETLARIGRLRHAVGEAVQHAQAARQEFDSRSARLRAQREQALEAERRRAAKATEDLRAAAGAERLRIEDRFQARSRRLTRALDSARQNKLKEIEAEESRHTFAIQRDLLEADRKRETDTSSNKAHHDDFVAQLAQEQARLEQLESSFRSTLNAYGSLRRLIDATSENGPGGAEVPGNESELIETLAARLTLAEGKLRRIHLGILPLLFRWLPPWLLGLAIIGAAFALVPELREFKFLSGAGESAALKVLMALGAVGILYLLGKRITIAAAKAAAAALVEASALHTTCAAKCEASFAAETERILFKHTGTTTLCNNQWKQKLAEAEKLGKEWTERLERRVQPLRSILEGRSRDQLAHADQASAAQFARAEAETRNRKEQIEVAHSEGLAKLSATLEGTLEAVQADWAKEVVPTYQAIATDAQATDRLFPKWEPGLWEGFKLPTELLSSARFGELVVDLEQLSGVPLKEERLRLPGPARFIAPLLLDIPRNASLLFETRETGQEAVIGALNNLVLRLLTSAPPGRLAFTIFDPVGLGQNFAGIMHLADYEERLINGRIWTQQAQFEQRLADLNEHIEKVTQMYLRNEFATLAEYNAEAGRLAEKYHFLVIADFPVNFSDVAVKRLMNIAASGPRCGVHVLIHWNQRRPAPPEFVPDELRKNAVCITGKGSGFAITSAPAGNGAGLSELGTWGGLTPTLDTPPDAEFSTRLLQQIGRENIDSSRVEMPFDEVAPGPDEFWSLDTTQELRVPVGRTGAAKLQYLAVGKGTRQHALVAGKTGSGKSTLFHVIITNLALWCSPDQVEFYLVDFKKGVEFKCYATNQLPHARVVAIESDREFGLSVLQRVDDELKRRGDLFRGLGAQDIAGYKRAGGAETMPRVLLLIDEFQELFVEDDRVSQGASLLLDRIVRQGRAFGIHVILGSQTLGGAYTLARATLGQMVVRIALQCNEADALLIMNEDNPAPRLLSRPGEAIYNDDAGALQGNSPFQVVWLPDQVRDQWLAQAHTLAAARKTAIRKPIVFEGNAPADVRENLALSSALAAPTAGPIRAWLGAPNSIKGPTEAVFKRASGNHLLIVGQREEAALAMLVVSLVSLAAQHEKAAAKFLVFDCSPPGSAEAKLLEQAAGILPHTARLVRPAEVDGVMAELAEEQARQAENPGAAVPETYLLIHGLARNKKLRFDEELSFSMDPNAGPNAGLQFNRLICEGSSLGFHVIATCDTYNNLMRMLSRKAVSEFEMRVVFQMSANDSASLIESPQANNLGLHRALFYNGQEGWLETFRPYALPDARWLEEAGRILRGR
jgi:hypothetical protein